METGGVLGAAILMGGAAYAAGKYGFKLNGAWLLWVTILGALLGLLIALNVPRAT